MAYNLLSFCSMVIERNNLKKIAVIADDLTGANDTGVQFAKQGLKTIVLLDPDVSPSNAEENVVVVDSQSRALTPEEAYRKVARTARLFNNNRFPVIFKKIDSTLRGNLGREIDAIMDTCGREITLLTPAFPKNQRIVVGGYLFLKGIPLEATELARDPQCPINESHIPTLLSAQTSRKVGQVGIKSLVAGQGALEEALGKQITEGSEVIVCDAWDDEHLKMLAQAGMALKKSILWVGSAGLAETIPAALGMIAGPMETDRLNPDLEVRPILVLAGSLSRITRNQVGLLKQRSNMTYIEADPTAFLQPETAVVEVQHCFDLILQAFNNGRDVVVTSGYNDEIVDRTRQKALSLDLSSQETAEEIAKALGHLCRRIVSSTGLGGLVLTGGDIALSSCRLLKAEGIKVVEEVAPGIPLGLLKGGLGDGLKIITKAGAFGTEEALSRAVDVLKQVEKG